MSDALSILQLCSAREYVGEAARVIELSDCLRQSGCDVEIIVREGKSVMDEAARRGLPYSVAHMESRFRPVRDWQDIRLIRSRIGELEPDIVHVHRGKEHWLAAMAMRSMENAPPLVRTRHVLTPIGAHAANRWLYGKATDGLLAVSDAVRKSVQESAPFLRAKLDTVPGGIAFHMLKPPTAEALAEFRRSYDIPPESTLITCLARLAPVKGQEYLLRAMPAILEAQPDAILALAFPRASGYRQRLEEIARVLGIEKSLRWVGKLDHLAPLLANTHIGVLSSIGSEGWSRATVECMGFGIPMVATRVGCLPQIIRDGENGILAPPRDPQAISEAVLRLLADRGFRRKVGDWGRQDILRDYTIFAETLIST